MHASFSNDLHSIKMVDVFNLLPNVGWLHLALAESNDAGLPPGILGQCTGTLIHERVVLVAVMHRPGCRRASAVHQDIHDIQSEALDRSTWQAVSDLVTHPSLPPCPPPDLCTFEGLAPDILDIGLVFLSQPVRGISPGAVARPGTLETARAKRSP